MCKTEKFLTGFSAFLLCRRALYDLCDTLYPVVTDSYGYSSFFFLSLYLLLCFPFWIRSVQLSLFEIFNEPEFFSDDSEEPEVSEIIVSSHTRKPKTLREENLKVLPVRVYEHELKKEELDRLFPNGYKEIKPVVYKRLSIIPQTFLVDEHRIHQYTSKDNDGRIIKAKRSPDLFRNSIATASLVAAIINGKFNNHLPLERQSRCYKDSGVNLETNTMANWMMRATEIHLNILYEELLKELITSSLIHADETPFEVIRDGRSSGAKSYMWVYCTGESEKHQVILYDYRSTRKADHPKEFLRNSKKPLPHRV